MTLSPRELMTDPGSRAEKNLGILAAGPGLDKHRAVDLRA
jgi:hypothetical protein